MPGLDSDHVHVSALSMTPQHTIVLSWNLLIWISTEGGIPCSFTNFIQLQSYPVLCISARIFIMPRLQNIHCRPFIGELFLSTANIFRIAYCVRSPSFSLDPCFLNPDWIFTEHLYRARPTEMIFHLLRSIRSERLIRKYSTKFMIDTLEIIIGWLQVSDSDMQPTNPHTENPVCV